MVRALVGWGLASFAILQVVEPIVHALDLPDWSLKAVVGALAAGFPLTAALAWIFDLTARGVERTPAAPQDGASSATPPSRLRLALLLLGVGAVAAAPGVAFFLVRRPAEGPEQTPGARIPVAVADFENDTGEPELDALSGLLITSLEQSRRLEVMTRSRMVDVLRQLGHAEAPRIDETLGREVGRRASVRALVLATIHRFDSLYTIELKALEPGSSTYLFTLKEDGKGKSSVPGMIDRLSERTRERLRERPAEVASSRVEVAQAITPNLEAYQHFFAAKALADGRADYPAAIAELKLAVALDPAFAAAQYEIAYLGVWADLPEAERRAALEAALRGAARAPEKERALILAWKAHLDGRDEEAEATYARAVQAFPSDKALQFFAGDLRFHAFLSPRGSTVDLAAVLPHFQAAATLDPTDGETQGHLVGCLQLLGRDAEAVAAARAWVATTPTSRAHSALGTALALAGQPEPALEAQRRALDLGPGTFSLASHARLLSRLGRLDEAWAELQAQGPRDSPMDQVVLGVARVEALAAQGRLRLALTTLEAMPEKLALAERTDVPARTRVALLAALGTADRAWSAARPLVEAAGGVDLAPLYLALAGDLPHAAAAARLLAPGSRQLAFHGAAVAWREGRLDEAAGRLAALARGPYAGDRALATALLGELEAERGDDAAAIPALERYRADPHAMLLPIDAALRTSRTLLLLAHSYERIGDRARARERLGELLSRFRLADPDLPLLQEARDLAARPGPGAAGR